MKRQEVPDHLILDINNVSKTYYRIEKKYSFKEKISSLFYQKKKEILALKNVSFKVNKGEFISYAGANGSGKSTTLKILSGILRPSSGQVTVFGMNPAKCRIEIMQKTGVLFGQRTELWWDHSVRSSYEWKKVVWNIPEKEYQENLKTIMQLLDLKDIIDTFARELSLGQRMRADIGMLLLSSPQLIILDEPTLGLDVLSKKNIIKFLKYLNKEKGVTIIVTSHDMSDLEEMSDRIILLSKGSIIFDGGFDLLRKVRKNKMQLIIESNSIIPHSFNARIEGNKYIYDIEDKKSLKKIFAYLATVENIIDIELKKGSIEDLISDFYEEERNKC